MKKRGTRAGGWEFELPAVLAYLGQGEPTGSKVNASRTKGKHGSERPPASPPSSGVGPVGIQHHGELTASQRHKLAQANLMEDKLRVSRGQLVDAEEMRIVLGTMLAHLGKGLDGLPDTIVRRLELQDEAIPLLQALVDDLRRNMATDLQELLG